MKRNEENQQMKERSRDGLVGGNFFREKTSRTILIATIYRREREGSSPHSPINIHVALLGGQD